jgi:hypothetical protein
MTKARKGVWGKPDGYDKLPGLVRKAIDEIRQPDCEHTWTVFVDEPQGQMWMVCKTYDDDESYTVYAAKIEYEKNVYRSEE